MASSSSDAWKALTTLERICPLQADQLQILRLTGSFLKNFLSSHGKWYIEDGNLKELLNAIQVVLQSADLDIHRVLADFRKISTQEDWQMPMNMDSVLTDLLEKFMLLNPEVEKVYNILSRTSRSITTSNVEAVMGNLQSLLENTEDLIRCCNGESSAQLKEELKAVQGTLRSLRCFLGFTGKRCSKLGKLKDLLIHAELVVDIFSYVFYWCSVNTKMDDEMINAMKLQLCSQLQKFSPSQADVIDIYIKTLRASKSTGGNSKLVDELDLGFLDSLRDHALQLSDTMLSSMNFSKDQILSLQAELRSLTIFFAMDKPSKMYSEHGTVHNFLERTNAAIIDTACAIYLLQRDEQNRDKAGQLKIIISNLQHIMRIKEDARKEYEVYFLTFVPSQLPISYRQGIIGSDLKRIFEILNIEALVGAFKHQCVLVQNEMLSLSKAFSKITAMQLSPSLQDELEEQMMRFNDITPRTIYTLENHYPREALRWMDKLWLFNVIQGSKKIMKELEDLENRITLETSGSKGSRKIGAEGKKITNSLIDEARKMGKPLVNGTKKLHILSIADIRGIEDQIRWMETNVQLIHPLKGEVETLRLMASFLKVLLSCNRYWRIQDGNLKVFLHRIRTELQNAYLLLQRLLTDVIRISSKHIWYFPVDMDSMISNTLERFRLLKPDIQEVYLILSKPSRFMTCVSEEVVMENFELLLQNVENLLNRNSELVPMVKVELKAVQRTLRFLRNFLLFTEKKCRKIGILKDLLIHVESMAGSLSCLFYMCVVSDDKMKEKKMQLSSELKKLIPSQENVRDIYIKALQGSNSAKGNCNMDESDLHFLDSLKDYMLGLPDTCLMFMAPLKDQILSLLEELRFITCLAMDSSPEEDTENDQTLNDLFEHTSSMINEAGIVIFSLHNEEKNEGMAQVLNKKVSDLQTIILAAKEEARKTYDLHVPKSLRSTFPRTNAQGFIGTLLRYLTELLKANANLASSLRYHIEIVHQEILSVMKDFSNIAMQPSQCEKLQSLWTCLVDNAYHVECVIDSFVGGDGPLYCHKLGLFNAIEEIKTIKKGLETIKNKIIDDTPLQKPSVLSSKERLMDERTTTKIEIFGKEAEEIRDQLIHGSQKLSFLSIVGMPGIGKTTLADSVFQHSSITRNFHVRARCSVGQVHDKKRMLREILEEATGEGNKCKDDDLDQKVYQCLRGRRYLIFMDDIWDIRPWKDIRVSFPDDENGSRIIFTSRLDDIASQVGSESIYYHLSPISEEKSWEMLQVKLFGTESCPPDLLTVARKIAVNCKGLPLTIDLIVGILLETDRKNWNKVAESTMTYLIFDNHNLPLEQGRCRKALELSYDNLPNDLRPCFLYFGAFPEDANISTRTLILLWIAEGFVQLQEDEQRSIEDVAEDMLNNLISRNLVTVSRRGPLGGVKASRVHDLLHEFALSKAQEESFMLKIDGKANFPSSSSDSYQWGEQYRLCIYPHNLQQFLESNPSGTRSRSFICSDSVDLYPSSLNFRDFKLLRVLNIPHVSCHYCPTMFTLIHLRFLAIHTYERKILSEIHKLRNLETLIVYGMKIGESLWLNKISNMVRLRHCYFRQHVFFECHGKSILKRSFLLQNLRTLHHILLGYNEDIVQILKQMPNLVELKVIFYNPDGCYYPFPSLDFLNKLESLEVMHRYYNSPYPCKIIRFPPRLKKLVLSDFLLPWMEISEFGNLEYLEILKLKYEAFLGSTWNMVDGQFPKLKYLHMSDLDIEEWNASTDHLPSLEQLHVKHCKKLKEIPSCLTEIAALQKIKLVYCSESTVDSANRIKEEQEETGNEKLAVDIY